MATTNAKPKLITIYPGDGGALKIGALSDVAGAANYTAKINVRRSQNVEELVAGWRWFPGSLREPVQMFASLELPAGDREIIAFTKTRIFAWAPTQDDWRAVGSGFSEKGHRWEFEVVANKAIFNNGEDLLQVYTVGSPSVVPMHELREQGIAKVGHIGAKGGMLICGDVTEIDAAQMDKWFDGSMTTLGDSGWINSKSGISQVVSHRGVFYAISSDGTTASLVYSINNGRTWKAAVDGTGTAVTFPAVDGMKLKPCGNTLVALAGASLYFLTVSTGRWAAPSNVSSYSDYTFSDCCETVGSGGGITLLLGGGIATWQIATALLNTESGAISGLSLAYSGLADQPIGIERVGQEYGVSSTTAPLYCAAMAVFQRDGDDRIALLRQYSPAAIIECGIDGSNPSFLAVLDDEALSGLVAMPRIVVSAHGLCLFFVTSSTTATGGRAVIVGLDGSYVVSEDFGSDVRMLVSSEMFDGMDVDDEHLYISTDYRNAGTTPTRQRIFKVSLSDASVSLLTGAQGGDAIRVVGDYVYCATYNPSLGKVNKLTGAIVASGSNYTGWGCNMAVGQDGMIYTASWTRSSSTVRRYDPSTLEYEEFVGSGTDLSGLHAPVAASDGVYFLTSYCRKLAKIPHSGEFSASVVSERVSDFGATSRKGQSAILSSGDLLVFGEQFNGWAYLDPVQYAGPLLKVAIPGYAVSNLSGRSGWIVSGLNEVRATATLIESGNDTFGGMGSVGNLLLWCRISSTGELLVNERRSTDGAYLSNETSVSGLTASKIQISDGRLYVFPQDDGKGHYSVSLGGIIPIYGNDLMECSESYFGSSVVANTFWAHTKEEANALAENTLVCEEGFYNDETSCADGYVGATIPAGEYYSPTKDLANAAAEEALVCVPYVGWTPNPDAEASISFIHPATKDIWIVGSFTQVWDPMTSAFVSRRGFSRISDKGYIYGSALDAASGTVWGVVRQTGGKVIIYGNKISIGGSVRNIARLNSDGTVDESFRDISITYGLNGGVYCAEPLADGSIVIGGKFSSVNGFSRKNLAKLSPNGVLVDSWSCDATGEDGSADSGFVATLKAVGDYVMVGGSFDKIWGSTWSPGIARVFGSTGRSDPTFSSPFQNFFADEALPVPGEIDDDEETLYGSISKIIPVPSGGYLLSGDISDNYHRGHDDTNPLVNIGVILITESGARNTSAWSVTSVGSDKNPFYEDGLNDWPTLYPAQIAAHSIDEGGNVYVSGNFHSISGTYVSQVARLLPSGALDASWTGKPAFSWTATTPHPSSSSAPDLVVDSLECGGDMTLGIDPDNKLYKTGPGGWRDTLVESAKSCSIGTSPHEAYIDSDGVLYMRGSNEYGQLGIGRTSADATPEQAATWRREWQRVASGVAQVSCGGWHTHYVSTDGGLYSFGRNDKAQLATGLTDRSSPVRIKSDVTKVFAGRYKTSLYLHGSNNELLVHGDNAYQQIAGAGTEKILLSFGVATGVIDADAGFGHVAFVKSDGSLWTRGKNDYGQCGTGTSGPNLTEFTKVVNSGVVSVSCGGDFTIFVKSDGSLWGMGRNDFGQLCDGTRTTRTSPTQALAESPAGNPIESAKAAGLYSHGYTMFRDSSGKVWGCGYNAFGQLGDGTTIGTYFGEGEGESRIRNIEIQADGKVIFSGGFNAVTPHGGAPTERLHLARFNTDWTLD